MIRSVFYLSVSSREIRGQNGTRIGVTSGLTSLRMTAINQTCSELYKYLRFAMYFISFYWQVTLIYSIFLNLYSKYICCLYFLCLTGLGGYHFFSLCLTHEFYSSHLFLLSVAKLNDLNTANTLLPIENT